MCSYFLFSHQILVQHSRPPRVNGSTLLYIHYNTHFIVCQANLTFQVRGFSGQQPLSCCPAVQCSIECESTYTFPQQDWVKLLNKSRPTASMMRYAASQESTGSPACSSPPLGPKIQHALGKNMVDLRGLEPRLIECKSIVPPATLQAHIQHTAPAFSPVLPFCHFAANCSVLA